MLTEQLTSWEVALKDIRNNPLPKMDFMDQISKDGAEIMHIIDKEMDYWLKQKLNKEIPSLSFTKNMHTLDILLKNYSLTHYEMPIGEHMFECVELRNIVHQTKIGMFVYRISHKDNKIYFKGV